MGFETIIVFRVKQIILYTTDGYSYTYRTSTYTNRRIIAMFLRIGAMEEHSGPKSVY